MAGMCSQAYTAHLSLRAPLTVKFDVGTGPRVAEEVIVGVAPLDVG